MIATDFTQTASEQPEQVPEKTSAANNLPTQLPGTVTGRTQPTTRRVNLGTGGTEVTQEGITAPLPPSPSPDAARVLLWRQASESLERIRVKPGILSAKPTIRETRISISQVLDMLAEYRTSDKVIAEFDGLIDAQDIAEALTFAARMMR